MTLWDGDRWVPDQPTTAPPRRGRRLLGAASEAILITALMFGLIAGTAVAAKGGDRGKPAANGGTGTITHVPLDSTDGLAHFGLRVTFEVATTATDSPFVHLRCSQAGTLVLEGYQGFFSNALGSQWFRLGPTPLWQGGAADCIATLEKYGRNRWQVLASTGFHVEP